MEIFNELTKIQLLLLYAVVWGAAIVVSIISGVIERTNEKAGEIIFNGVLLLALFNGGILAYTVWRWLEGFSATDNWGVSALFALGVGAVVAPALKISEAIKLAKR